jgi:hypothetical protein
LPDQSLDSRAADALLYFRHLAAIGPTHRNISDAHRRPALRGTLNAAVVKAPGFGDRRKALLEDIAIPTAGGGAQGQVCLLAALFLPAAGLSAAVQTHSSEYALTSFSPRPEHAAIMGGNVISEAAWQNEGAWVAEGNSEELMGSSLQVSRKDF